MSLSASKLKGYSRALSFTAKATIVIGEYRWCVCYGEFESTHVPL